MTFENRDDLTKKCRFFPIIDVPDRNNGHNGKFQIIIFDEIFFLISSRCKYNEKNNKRLLRFIYQ
jgi:hypothetical protein